MKKAFRMLATLMILMFAAAIFSTIPASASLYSPPPLLMTEFAMNPAGTDFRGEYVEIYNCTDQPIDLKEYKLAYRNSQNAGVLISFNEITKYAKSDITYNSKVEPDKALIEPGETGVIWIKGNSGSSNASEWTTEDFLNAYAKIPDEINMFIAEHDITSSSEFVTGGNFYMLNHSGEAWIYLYLVRAEATVENYQEHIITGFESQVADFQTNSYVQLQYDGTTGLTKVFEIVSGDRVMVYDYIGAIMPEQDPYFDPSTTTTAETTTPPPVTTAKPKVTTAPPTTETNEPADEGTTKDPTEVTTQPPSKKKSCGGVISFGMFALLVPAAAVIVKKKK